MRFDAVLVLGKELRRDPGRGCAELRARAAAASAVHRAGVPLVLSLEARLRGQAEAGSSLVATFLREFGVPEAAMHLQTVTHSTREEAVVVLDVVEQLGCRRLLAITASYHVQRARLCLAQVVGAERIAVHPPQAFVQHASDLEHDAIVAGEVSPDAHAIEARVEATLTNLELLVRPLPTSLRWQLEIWAGRCLRSPR